jgi:hypothetical protein
MGDLAKSTVLELRKLAAQHGIAGRSTMRKADLVAALQRVRGKSSHGSHGKSKRLSLPPDLLELVSKHADLTTARNLVDAAPYMRDRINVKKAILQRGLRMMEWLFSTILVKTDSRFKWKPPPFTLAGRRNVEMDFVVWTTDHSNYAVRITKSEFEVDAKDGATLVGALLPEHKARVLKSTEAFYKRLKTTKVQVNTAIRDALSFEKYEDDDKIICAQRMLFWCLLFLRVADIVKPETFTGAKKLAHGYHALPDTRGKWKNPNPQLEAIRHGAIL